MLIVPYERARRELAVSNSRFPRDPFPRRVGRIGPGLHPGAQGRIPRRHASCPGPSSSAGGNTTTEYCSDDGEPSGSSGRPLLALLKGSGLGDVAVVVTRWFGGTLLGTGGLSRAYSGAGRLVVEAVRRASVVEVALLALDLPYQLFDRLRLVAAETGALIIEEAFDEVVHLRLEIPSSALELFGSRLAAISSGALKASIESRRMARTPL